MLTFSLSLTHTPLSLLQLVPEYEARAKQLEEQVEAFKRLKEMEEKIEDLEKERQWAIVVEIENVRGDAVHITMVYCQTCIGFTSLYPGGKVRIIVRNIALPQW